jgi:hypothetical protein
MEEQRYPYGIEFVFPIPHDSGEMPAPFIQCDFTEPFPVLRATRGRNCSVHTRPLRARPDPYPRPAFEPKQEFLFHDDQVFTTAVDIALGYEGDVTLKAEVQRFRNARAMVSRTAQLLIDVRNTFTQARKELLSSRNALAQANAFQRIEPRVIFDIVLDPLLAIDRRTLDRAIEVVEDPWVYCPTTRPGGCLMCMKEGHDTEECIVIRECLYCGRQGHGEERCFTPHKGCARNEPCQVPTSHHHFHKPCLSIIRIYCV